MTNSLAGFQSLKNHTYNLANVYDYVVYNFYSYLRDANMDSMSWSSMQVSIERVEGLDWDNAEQLSGAIDIVKTIGLLNLFGIASFTMNVKQLIEYTKLAMDMSDSEQIIKKLQQFKIIRFAAYKQRFILFEGTDIDLELEIRNASAVIARPTAFIDELRQYINKRISTVKKNS